jgi:hypothetical protein
MKAKVEQSRRIGAGIDTGHWILNAEHRVEMRMVDNGMPMAKSKTVPQKKRALHSLLCYTTIGTRINSALN